MNEQTKFIITATLGLLIALLSVILNSRAFMFGSMIGLLYILYSFEKLDFKKVGYGILLLLGLIIVLAVFHKTDSSLGRLLIYKITLNILYNNFPFGIGLNNFEHVYLDYQAEYFKNDLYTTKELLLADNTYFAFNDYLQFIVETGIIGLALIVLFFLLIYLLHQKSSAKKSKAILYIFSWAQILNILCAAFFMYVFEILVFQVLFVVFLSIVTFFALTGKARFFLTFFYFLVLIFFGSISEFCNNIFLKDKYKTFEQAVLLNKAGFKTETLDSMKELYQFLKHDPNYLSVYANVLIKQNEHVKAKEILIKAITINKRNDFYLQLGECYLLDSNYSLAEYYMKKSIYMVPNRFNPRKKLFELYYSTGQYAMACRAGEEILVLPVKVPSPIISEIKYSVMEKLRFICDNETIMSKRSQTEMKLR